MSCTAPGPQLPLFGHAPDDNADVDVVINWGLGVESTAYIARMLTAPATHGIDLKRTVVLYMATGSEWPETRLLVEKFMLPLLREHRVRFVQLARNGHLRQDGFTVLDDSRTPERLFARGPWTLWDDLESVGTVPQQAGTRKCSLWAKGDVGDWWLGQLFDGRPFRQIMGFNADEEGRRFGDQAASKMPGRTGEFPLIDWGWGRQRCEDYLLERFGVHWPKSYCTFCCFPASMGALPAHLERMRCHPELAGAVLRLEYTAMSLNPNARLYGRRSLLELLDPDQPRDRACLDAFERELDMPWALYRVRRLFLLSHDGRRRPVMYAPAAPPGRWPRTSSPPPPPASSTNRTRASSGNGTPCSPVPPPNSPSPEPTAPGRNVPMPTRFPASALATGQRSAVPRDSLGT
ncbi:hypothetical protein N4G70_32005 [Streptomyces sp. ASQP_92]|uniref:hypothetical protein n=1 Tax=Streptomyces sp. ASQP_92 TaxID=2979116 RepID=UPI0021BEDC6D|nr:hypothetical protein [Streptomyces sp. ASQP_92]MCT9093459.1 hypothetical protein [Streptomyces sp. ASQP_92]